MGNSPTITRARRSDFLETKRFNSGGIKNEAMLKPNSEGTSSECPAILVGEVEGGSHGLVTDGSPALKIFQTR